MTDLAAPLEIPAEGRVRAIAVSPDGALLALHRTIVYDAHVEIFELPSGRLRSARRAASETGTLVFLDGARLAFPVGRELYVETLATGERHRVARSHEARCAPSGQWAWAGEWERTWVSSGDSWLDTHGNYTRDGDDLNDREEYKGSRVLLADRDGEVARRFDASAKVRDLAWIDDRTLGALTEEALELFELDADARVRRVARVATREAARTHVVRSGAGDADVRILVEPSWYGHAPSTVRAYRRDGAALASPLSPHPSAVRAMATSRSCVVTADQAGTLRSWEGDGRPLAEWPAGGEIGCVAVARVGARTIVAAEVANRGVRVWGV